jgi:endonuclease/exonuclease/phosphatase family metal-dependent hydrolase
LQLAWASCEVVVQVKRGEAEIYRDTVAALPLVDDAARVRMLALPPTRETHAALIKSVEALRLVEVAGDSREPIKRSLRVGYWNAERFSHFDACCELIRGAFDVLLLGEMDIGMARSRQRHCLGEAAAVLGANYAFGSEFLELGLGDANERRIFAGAVNEVGLHGNGILSPMPLVAPALIRLETDGDWFDGRHGERRVGGRSAVAATMDTRDGEILVVNVHLESHSGPEMRAEQMRCLFAAIDRLAPKLPVVIGGDLNTSTLTRTSTDQRFDRSTLIAKDPQRFLHPQPYEPLFRLAKEHGYAWEAANAPGPTERTSDPMAGPLGKIDWFLTRGLAASKPAIIPAVDGQGRMISDHDAIAVTVERRA